MEISKDIIQKYIELHREDFGEEIDEKKATVRINQLVMGLLQQGQLVITIYISLKNWTLIELMKS